MYQSLLRKVQPYLQGNLPGIKAHEKMAPNANARLLPTDTEISQARQAAVLVLLYERADEFMIPLIRRVEYDGVHSGQIAFPGGKREQSDQSIIGTAYREAYEEVGIREKEVEFLLQLTDVYTHPSKTIITPILAYSNTIPHFIRQELKVADIISLPINTLFDDNYKTYKTIEVRGAKLENVPCYVIDELTIWGATACILSELEWILYN